MEKKKKQKKRKYSWKLSVLLLFLASSILVLASMYTAECMLELAMNQEYLYYISTQKPERNRNRSGYDDGIYHENIAYLSEKFGLDYTGSIEQMGDNDANWNGNDGTYGFFMYCMCHIGMGDRV